MSAEPRRVLLVNLGTPESPTAEGVRAFLAEFLADPAVIDLPSWLWQPLLRSIILRTRPRRVAKLYRSIWTSQGSPLEVGTARIAAGLADAVPLGTEVGWAYRYGQPSIADALRTRRQTEGRPAEPGEIVVLPLYAQRTSSTTGTVFDEARRLARLLGLEDRVRMAVVEPDDPGYIAANVSRCRDALEKVLWEPEHLLLSFHGIPARYDRREGGQYSADCERTAAQIIAGLGWDRDRATLCYQSRFGPERWLGPATADLLEELPRRGIRRLAVVLPGFFTEGLETLEEIGIQGREAFLGAGGTDYLCVPTAEDHPDLVAALARIAAAL